MLTKIDPVGFRTRIHSAVQSSRLSMYSPGVFSSPICPA